jgi:hypothetical protein
LPVTSRRSEREMLLFCRKKDCNTGYRPQRQQLIKLSDHIVQEKCATCQAVFFNIF